MTTSTGTPAQARGPQTGGYAPEAQAAFIGRLLAASPDELGMLRRNLEESFYESRGVFGIMARLMGENSTWTNRQRDDYFLVACVASLLPLARPRRRKGQKPQRKPASPGNFGASLRRLREQRGDTLDRQVETLLDADRETLRHHLTVLAQDVATAKFPIDLALLLSDVLRWPSPIVKQAWANSYFFGVRATAITEEATS